MRTLLTDLFRETNGQDLVEYALLTAFIGLAVYAGFDALKNTIALSYGAWDAGNQDLWEPPPPGSSGS